MLDAETRRYISNEIRKQLQVITAGETVKNDTHTEDIGSLFPGMPTVTGRPLMHQYGVSSRAPVGTKSVTAKVGDHPGAAITLGHRDKDKPNVEEGETKVYSVGKFTLYVAKDSIKFGKDSDFEVVPVGETLKDFLVSLIELIVQHTHLGNLGYPTGVPQNSADFTQLQANNLDNEKILAKDGGRF